MEFSAQGAAVHAPIFDAIPGLAERMPRIPLVHAPTPVQFLERLSSRVGREIWIKRDDLSSPLYGGNKPRKLEFLLAEARARGARTLVTAGGIGTNHGLATAIFGKETGFQVVLCLFDQPVTDHVRKNLLLFRACGAEIVYGGSRIETLLRFFLLERMLRRNAFLIPLGGSSPRGVLGFVNAGLEFALQVEKGELPKPGAVFVAVGSCGTLAGLVLGFRLAGVSVPVVGVRVAPLVAVNRRAVFDLARRAQQLLAEGQGRQSGPTLLSKDAFSLDSEQYGGGYGHPTEAGCSAQRLAEETEGIRLEPTYTAKTLASLLQHGRRGTFSGPLLFWNTFNSADLAGRLAGVKPEDLPRPLNKFFAGPEESDKDKLIPFGEHPHKERGAICFCTTCWPWFWVEAGERACIL